MKKWRLWGSILVLLLWLHMDCVMVQAGTIYDSPYVSFSPDGKAWTTNAGVKDTVWYAADGADDIITGVNRTLADLQAGEHYYSYKRTGRIPVAKWIVHTPKVNCCHNGYPPDGEFHGVRFVMQTCYKPHFSGWYPICADCGNVSSQWNFYMSKAAARSLGYLDYGEDMGYYYLCPFNQNLEMGVAMKHHTCKTISANRYRVVYDANTGEDLHSGYMSPSFHMYNNATLYEGREVTPQKNLNLNTFERIGWEFVGWNTAADGSGAYYADGAEILNLCSGDWAEDEVAGTTVLYAMWEPSKSILEIDPNGGYYEGEAEIVEIEGEYGSVLTIDNDSVIMLDALKVDFDTCGGDALDSIELYGYFSEWKQSVPFQGQLQENKYWYKGTDGSRDRITALYEISTCYLPEPYRENYSFTGWYYDSDYLRKAGNAGDEFATKENVTLYAQWAELTLTSENSEVSCEALDLFWNQDDGQVKNYKLYQCAAGQEWKQIYEMDDETEEMEFSRTFECCEKEEEFVVPYTGFYRVEAYGAQGADYDTHKGGLGGKVEATFWLEEGQKVSVCVGGQYGYNGGGESGLYQCGGGYTSVSTEEDLLLIAGGGGGAGDGGDGGAGGLETSLVEEGHTGEKGEAGGGGGYLGGRAGETQRHYHETGVCNHVHTGNSSEQGGCYTEPIQCGNTLTHTHTRTEYWSWGGSDESYCPNCGADASKGETCTGHETKYYQHDCPVHGKRASNKSSSTPNKCSQVVEYGLTCERSEEYICGYPEDGYIISSSPSYGGSSYANEELATFYLKTAGVREGDGYVIIRSENLGFLTDTKMEDVLAEDLAAPESIVLEAVKLDPVGESSLIVRWNNTQDLGTVYYHKAESYLLGSTEILSVSNTTMDNMVSGMDGYLYILDNYSVTEVTIENGKYLKVTDEPGKLEITLTEENQYLHVVAIDKACNISEAVHIPLGSIEGGEVVVKRPVLTKPLKIEDSESVYSGEENVYYVKSDGRTPFGLCFDAYMQGAAFEKYQLNYAIVESDGVEGEKIRNTIYIPSGNVSENEQEYCASDMRFKNEGEGYLQNDSYTVATRSNHCRNLQVRQEYVLFKTAHGKRIHLIPVAGVDDAGEIIYSDYEKDKQNGLWIVGDGEAPVISGMEQLEDLPLLDRRVDIVMLQVSAVDELSGVGEFYLEIENQDNGAKEIYTPGEDGIIDINITVDNTVFNGDFTVTAYARDHVGNEVSLCYGTTEFYLRAEIKSAQQTNKDFFRRGEYACLNISAWGYVERIEVEFPEAFSACNPNLNRIYEYELKGAYRQDEQLKFMIPFGVLEDTAYNVTVRAYKGEKKLEEYPELLVLRINGTILDDLRTRLR